MGRPGILFYFDLLPALDTLQAEDVGTLFLAAMHYAKDDKEPKFANPALSFAWALIRPSIDRDGSAYREKKDRGEWLTYCRECKRVGTEPLLFDDWRQRTVNGTLSGATKPLPTTATATTTTQLNTESNIGIGAAKPPKPTSRFTPPSVEEVTAYCRERKNHVSAERFVDFYQARGWMLGKNKMKDWRAAVRTWEREGRDGKTSDPTATPGGDTSRWGKIKSVKLD